MVKTQLKFFFGYHGDWEGEMGAPTTARSREFFRTRVGRAMEEAVRDKRPCAVIHELIFTPDEAYDPAFLRKLCSGRGAVESIGRRMETFRAETDALGAGSMSRLDEGRVSAQLRGLFGSVFGYIDTIVRLNSEAPRSVLNFIEPQTVETLTAGLCKEASVERMHRALAWKAYASPESLRRIGTDRKMMGLAKDSMNSEFLHMLVRDLEVAALASRLSREMPGGVIIVPRGVMHTGMTSLFSPGGFELSAETDDSQLGMGGDEMKLLAAQYLYARRSYEGTGLAGLAGYARAVLDIETRIAASLAHSRSR